MRSWYLPRASAAQLAALVDDLHLSGARLGTGSWPPRCGGGVDSRP